MKFIFSILFLMVLFSCKEEAKKNEKNIFTIGNWGRHISFSKEEIRNSIFGEYSTPKRNGGAFISLFKDSFYEYRSFSCTSSSIDSGYFSLHTDTILFKSLIVSEIISKDGFEQIAHLKYSILKNKKITIHPLLQTLYKLYIGHENLDELNNNGNGEIEKLDTLNRIIESGTYENYKLYTGWKEIYNTKQDEYRTTTYYKNGKIDTSRN